jgi:hypothetical protein
VLANHAKLGESTETTRSSVVDLQSNAVTYDYAVFDLLTALGTASELQSRSQIGDGTHLDQAAYAIAGHLLTTDIMTPIHGWLAGKSYTTGLAVASIGAGVIVVGDSTFGGTYLNPLSGNPPPLRVTSGAYDAYFDVAGNFNIRTYGAGTTQFRITVNPFSWTNQFPAAPLHFQNTSLALSSYSPFTSLTTGTTVWVHQNNFRLRNNSNNQRLHLGPFVNTTALDLPSIAAGGEHTATVTVTGASATEKTVVQLGWDGTLPAGIIVAQAWVSATSTVSIRFYNYTGSPIDPTSLTVNVSVMEVATS